MRFPDFRQPLTVFIISLVLSLTVQSHGIAEEEASILSGRVVDMEGHPVSDLTLAVQPIDIIDGEMWQTPMPMQQSLTDSAGSFRIGGIVPGPAKLVIVPKTGTFQPDTEIYAIDIGGLSFLPIDNPNLKIKGNIPLFRVRLGADDPRKVSAVGGIPLYIRSGVDIEDITVKVRPRMRIRGQVLSADEIPLAKAIVKFNLRYRSLDDIKSGDFSVTPTYTDSDGYFVKYVNLPIFCTVSVEYQGDMATVETFKIGEGQRRHDLIFRLSNTPIPAVPNAPAPRPEDVQVPLPIPPRPDPIGIWAVNPANGHAYKKIQCKSWEDAGAMAIAEGAHLVSINDEAEQEWLVEKFGREPFLIGLTRPENQTEWQWTSGEPLAYTNWFLQEFPTKPDVLVFVSIIDGKWHIGTPESLQRIGIALLEKADDQPDKPQKDK